MKNIFIVLTVLAMASAASATLSLSVNGDPALPESEFTVEPSDVTVIDVDSVGEKCTWTLIVAVEGPATMDLANMWIIEIPDITSNMIADLSGDPGFMGYVNTFVPNAHTGIYAELLHVSDNPAAIPDGKIIDGIGFHCDAEGDVIVTLLDGADGSILDTAVIHQVPEPITFALLGLGGLFLRRRK